MKVLSWFLCIYSRKSSIEGLSHSSALMFLKNWTLLDEMDKGPKTG